MKDFILCLCLLAMVVLHGVTLVRVDKLEKRVSSLGPYQDMQSSISFIRYIKLDAPFVSSYTNLNGSRVFAY